MPYPLFRDIPVSERVVNALAEAVTAAARHVLAARRIATFEGPRGWDVVALPLGTLTERATPASPAIFHVPDLVVLPEIRAAFRLPWALVETFERGAPALDTAAAEEAAVAVARAEDVAAFYGEPLGSGFLMSPESPRVVAGDWTRHDQLIADLLRAVRALDDRGVAGPYEAVLASDAYYTYLAAAAPGGYPTARHLKAALAGVHRSQVLRTRGAVFSTRGGDFILTVGGDLTVGYRSHDAEALDLFCVETVAAQLQTPHAVCLLED
jgi:uncharacterized linocin/CFP29 family protein